MLIMKMTPVAVALNMSNAGVALEFGTDVSLECSVDVELECSLEVVSISSADATSKFVAVIGVIFTEAMICLVDDEIKMNKCGLV